MKIQERYRSKTPRQALAHVIEECGEVLAAAGKTLRFGPWSTNPESPAAKPEANFRWLMREMADLEAAMTPLIETRDALADLVRAIEPLSEEGRLLTDRLIELDEEIARLEDWPGIECQWEPT